MTRQPLNADVDGRAVSWSVGRAGHADASGVVVAAQELLLELGAKPPPAHALKQTVGELLDDDDAGAVFVARTDRDVIGLLGASWQVAIHVPGQYATIQDLWVHPAWRSRSVGRELIDALVDACRARGIALIDVGMPRDGYRALGATEAFYLDNEFAPLGPRMRRVLA
jgi:GNAT superfamily N-acetyltransferase